MRSGPSLCLPVASVRGDLADPRASGRGLGRSPKVFALKAVGRTSVSGGSYGDVARHEYDKLIIKSSSNDLPSP